MQTDNINFDEPLFLLCILTVTITNIVGSPRRLYLCKPVVTEDKLAWRPHKSDSKCPSATDLSSQGLASSHQISDKIKTQSDCEGTGMSRTP